MGGASRKSAARNPSLFSEQASSRFFEKNARAGRRRKKLSLPGAPGLFTSCPGLTGAPTPRLFVHLPPPPKSLQPVNL